MGIHLPLKRRMPLGVEELESRTAPVTLTNGMSYSFTDLGGDVVLVTFAGRGEARVLNAAGGDPVNEDIAFIDLVNTDLTSKLCVTDMLAGDGDDQIRGGNITGVGGASMGLIQLEAQIVRLTEIVMSNALGTVNILGAFYASGVTAGNSVKAVQVSGWAELTGYWIAGDLGSFSVGAGILESTMVVQGGLGSMKISGGDMVGARATVYGYTGKVDIFGNVMNSPMSQAEIHLLAGAGSVSVHGDFVDSILNVWNGNCGKIVIDGSIIGDSVGMHRAEVQFWDGKLGSIFVGGGLDYAYLGWGDDVAGQVTIVGDVANGSEIEANEYGVSCAGFSIGGAVSDSRILVAFGSISRTSIGGDVSASTITVNSADLSQFLIGGNLTGSSILTLSHGKAGSLTIGGSLNGGVVAAMGYAIGNMLIAGDFCDASAVQVMGGGIGRLRIGGSMFNGTGAATLMLNNAACGSLSIAGDLYDGAQVMVGPGAFLGRASIGGMMSDSAAITCNGSELGGVTVGGGMFSGARIACNSGTVGNIVVNGPMDSLLGPPPSIQVMLGVCGSITVKGSVVNALFQVASSSFRVGSSVQIMGDLVDSTMVLGGGTLRQVAVRGGIENSMINIGNGDVQSFTVGGNVLDAAVTMTSSCGSMVIGGYVDLLTVNIAGSNPTFRVGGYADNMTYYALGAVKSFFIGGHANSTSIDSDGGISRVYIKGGGDALNIGELDVPTDSLYVGGDWTNGTMHLWSTVGTIQVAGSLTNTHLHIYDGCVGTILIRGNVTGPAAGEAILTGDGPDIPGVVGRVQVMGNVGSAVFQFGSRVGELNIGGTILTSTVTVLAGGMGKMVVGGDVDTSTVVVAGPTGTVAVGGDVTNGSALAFNNGLRSVKVTGALRNASTVTSQNGSEAEVTTATIQGGMWGTSTLWIGGNASMVKIAGGINDSILGVIGYAKSIAVAGDITAAAVVQIGEHVIAASGQVYDTGTLRKMTVTGLIYGRVDVFGTLHAIDTQGTAAAVDPGPYPDPAFTGGFQTRDAGGAILTGRVYYVALAPGGHVS